MSRLTKCGCCDRYVGLSSMYCLEHTPSWEFPLTIFTTMFPFVFRITENDVKHRGNHKKNMIIEEIERREERC